MKTINYSACDTNLSSVLNEIADTGEIACIALASGGNVVAMEKSQFDIMLNALRMVFAASASVNSDSQAVSVSDALNNFDGLSQ